MRFVAYYRVSPYSFAATIQPLIQQIHRSGVTSYRGIRDECECSSINLGLM